MGQKVYSQNGVLLGVPVGGSTQNLKAGDGITIDDNYISVDAHTSGNIEGNGTTDNPITLKDSITLGTVNADTVTGVKGNFGDVLIGRSDKVSVFIQKVKDLEAAQHEYTGGDHITVTDYVINLDNDVALKSDLPDLTPYALKTSLQDYIKSDALNNYYTKNETYNKNEIIEMLDAREYVGSEHIDITDGVISVKDLANTTVTSNNQTVTVIPTINEDGSTNYDLSVVGGQGGDTNIVGKWPVWSVDNGDGNWLVGADMTEWIKGKDVDEKLTAYQLIMTAGSDNVHIENNKISVDDTVYTGTAPIIVTDKVISFDDSAYATKQALATEVTNRTNADDTLQDEIDDLQDQIDNLPGALTAGDHIDITNGVISVTGIKDHEYTGDEYIIVDNTNDKITLLPKWVDWSTYWSEQLAIKGRATSLEGRMTAVENGKADIGLLNNYYTKSETLNVTEINNLVASKQDKLTAGDHISIVGNTISATGFDSLATKSELTAETNARIAGDNALAEEIAEKQDPISAGDHIRIDDGVTINAVGLATSEELTAETNARTSADTTLQNNINGKQDKLTAGDGIKIENNVISVDAGTEDVYNLAAGTGITLTKDDTNKEVVIATTGLASANDLTQEVIARTNSYSYLEGQLATKQPTLTAGSNITISDDNVISADVPDSTPIFVATYGTSTYEEISNAITNGYACFCVKCPVKITSTLTLVAKGSDYIQFRNHTGAYNYIAQVKSDNTWSYRSIQYNKPPTIGDELLFYSSNSIATVHWSSTDTNYTMNKPLLAIPLNIQYSDNPLWKVHIECDGCSDFGGTHHLRVCYKADDGLYHPVYAKSSSGMSSNDIRFHWMLAKSTAVVKDTSTTPYTDTNYMVYPSYNPWTLPYFGYVSGEIWIDTTYLTYEQCKSLTVCVSDDDYGAPSGEKIYFKAGFMKASVEHLYHGTDFS